MTPRIRIFDLVPVSCGHVHRHYSEILACIEDLGRIPGFEFAEVPP